MLAAALAALTIALNHQPAPTVAGHRITSYQSAVRAFGKPTRVRSSCDALWDRLALEVDSCSSIGIQITVTAKTWRTTAGLRVGDTAARAHALYPQGRSLAFLARGSLWQLETGGVMCDGGPTLALAAKLAGGRVTALEVVLVPACG